MNKNKVTVNKNKKKSVQRNKGKNQQIFDLLRDAAGNRNAKTAPTPLYIGTTADSIPVVGLHDKYNLIETYPGCYTRSYDIGNCNYLTATEQEQEAAIGSWKRLLNAMGDEMECALTIANTAYNETEYFDQILIKETGDGYDNLRKDLNTIITSRVRDGQNGINRKAYFTTSVHTDSAKKAAQAYAIVDKTVMDAVAKIRATGSGTATKTDDIIVSMADRLELIYGIYNGADEHLITKTRIKDDLGKTVETRSFDITNMRRQGIKINDLLAPSYMEIKPDKIRLDNRYIRALQVTDLANQLTDEFFVNVTDTDYSCITTINYKPMDRRQAAATVIGNLSAVQESKQKQIKSAAAKGIFDDSAISLNLVDREKEALELRDEITKKDERLYATTITVLIMADTEEELSIRTQEMITQYKKYSVNLQVMKNMQEEGLNTTLPLCYQQLKKTRTLKSSSAAIFQPFSTLELADPNGINYSCNLISNNLILYDRLSSNNFNGFILGTPGSGKSFSAKVEMLSVFLKSNADIVVIDPENEYTALAKLLGGEVIEITPGGSNHINPMEIAGDYEWDGNEDGERTNPVNEKADFTLKLIECITKTPFGINSVQETIVDECVHELFAPFCDENGELMEIPADEMPTLTDLQIAIAKRKEPEAREIAMALKLYTGSGSLNTYGYRTNVHTNNRFVVYQIRDVGDRLKNLSMLTILDHIWGQIVANRKIGKNTWMYVDEIYLLFQNEYSATFLNTLFRRARKYGGVPTGITQNVSPLLESPTARDMLQNCCFIEILAQAGPDRDRLQELLNLSDAQVGYITSSRKGQGLIYTGSSVVPFYSDFPKNNEVYRALTSDLKEIKAYEAKEARDAAKASKEAKQLA